MKRLITDYTFDSAHKRIVFNEYDIIDAEGVLLITNVAENVIIYNFADSSLKGAVSSNEIVLDFDTSSMNDTDPLQIYYDDVNINSSTLEQQKLMEGVVEALYELISRLSFLPAVRGTAADLRTTVVGGSVSITGTPTVTTSTTSTIATLTNQVNMGGFSANTQIKNLDNFNFIQSNLNNIVT
jgi:hypothetical protein